MLRLVVRSALGAAAIAAPLALSSVRADGEQHTQISPPPALDASAFKRFKLSKVEQLTHDTNKYTFLLPHASDELGLTVASFLLVKGSVNGALPPLTA